MTSYIDQYLPFCLEFLLQLFKTLQLCNRIHSWEFQGTECNKLFLLYQLPPLVLTLYISIQNKITLSFGQITFGWILKPISLSFRLISKCLLYKPKTWMNFSTYTLLLPFSFLRYQKANFRFGFMVLRASSKLNNRFHRRKNRQGCVN